MPVASRFNLIMPVAGGSETLVFNTLRGSAALVDSPIGDLLGRALTRGTGRHALVRSFGNGGHHCDNAGEELRANIPDHPCHTLEKLGMITSCEADDARAVDVMLDDYWTPRTLKLTLSHTADCQMACAYCFQSGRDLTLRHTPALSASLMDWVETYLDTHPRLDSLHLGLFGGEPLADVGLAHDYVGRFGALAARRALGFTMSLTTNGLNLDRELIADWVGKGLQYVRVTLDGPPEVHDRRRPCRSGEPSFRAILQNLSRITDIQGFGLGVSINVDDENVHQIGKLLDILANAGLREEVEIILEPTLPFEGSQAGGARQPHHGALLTVGKAHQADVLAEALEQVIDKGFRTPLFPGLCKPCNFVQSNNFVIRWDGQLFRCSFTMLDPGMSVGNVFEGVSARNDELLSARAVAEYCLKTRCAYLPICAGGCRYQAWWQCSDWAGRNCPVATWDRLIPLSLTHFFDVEPVLSQPEGGSRANTGP